MSDGTFAFETRSEADDALSAITQRILSFGSLEAGWHFGEGRPATDRAVSAALAVLSVLHCYEVEAFPGVDGGILVAAYHDTEVLEARCEPDGRIGFWHEVSDEAIEERENVRLQEIDNYVGGLAWVPKKSNSYESCILSITAREGAGSPASPSGAPRRMVVSPFSMQRVPKEKAAASANTSGRFTLTWRGIRRCSGVSSPNMDFQMVGGASPANRRQPMTHATGTFGGLVTAKAEELQELA